MSCRCNWAGDDHVATQPFFRAYRWYRMGGFRGLPRRSGAFTPRNASPNEFGCGSPDQRGWTHSPKRHTFASSSPRYAARSFLVHLQQSGRGYLVSLSAKLLPRRTRYSRTFLFSATTGGRGERATRSQIVGHGLDYGGRISQHHL